MDYYSSGSVSDSKDWLLSNLDSLLFDCSGGSMSLIDLNIDSWTSVVLHLRRCQEGDSDEQHASSAENRLRNLRVLNLHSNALKSLDYFNHNPSSFLVNITNLDLSSNRVECLSGLSRLQNLKYLNLSSNYIQEIEPDVQGLKRLVWLNLSYNRIRSLKGIASLWGDEFCLEVLLVNNNYLFENKPKPLPHVHASSPSKNDLEHKLSNIIYYLNGLCRLKHVTLKGNFATSEGQGEDCLKYGDYLLKNLKIKLDTLDYFWTKSFMQNVQKNVRVDLTHLYRDLLKSGPKPSAISSAGSKEARARSQSPAKPGQKHHVRFESPERDVNESDRRQYERPPPSSQPDSAGNQDLGRQLIEIIKLLKDQNKEKDQSYQKLSADHTSLQKKHEELAASSSETIQGLKIKLDELKAENDRVVHQLEAERRDQELYKAKLENELNQRIKSAVSDKKADHHESDLKIRELQVHLEKINEELKANKETLNSELLKRKTDYENELREILFCETSRYKKLYETYMLSVDQNRSLNAKLKQLEKDEKRNKSLINELNCLIKEQKQAIGRLASEKSRENSIQVEKLTKENEILQQKIQLLDGYLMNSRDENQKKMRIVAAKMYKEIESKQAEVSALKSRVLELIETKNELEKKLAEQERQASREIEALKKQNESDTNELTVLTEKLAQAQKKEAITDAITRDHAETIRNLKEILVDRDAKLKAASTELVQSKKKLEAQLSNEMDLSNELKLKCDELFKSNCDLKSELNSMELRNQDLANQLSELSNMWKKKTEFIGELQEKVLKIKEDHDAKEKRYVQEIEKLQSASKELDAKLLNCDNRFRQMLDKERSGYLKEKEKLHREKEDLKREYDSKIIEIENEMRILLIETENKKKLCDEKIKNFMKIFDMAKKDFTAS